MALKLNDRVKETSTTTGTGTLNLSGAVSSFETFVAGIGDGNTTYYAIVNRDEDEWETGLGTVADASTDTLARTTVISSSNSDSATDFSAGTKDVFCTLPASKVSFLDASNDLILGTGAAGVDYSLKFDGETSDGVITWMEDEDSFKVEDDLVMDSSKRLHFYDEGGEYIYGDGTDLYLTSGADINIPANIGMTFGNDGEKIEGDGTDLTISGNNINLTATADVALAVNTGLLFAGTEKIESDGTDLSITVGAGGDINIGSDIGLTFGDDGEKIEGDGTDLTIASSGVLNLAAGGTTNQIKVTDGAILPITDDDVDLGSASYQFKNAYFDGTLEADAITIGGTAVTAGGASQGFAIAMSVAL